MTVSPALVSHPCVEGGEAWYLQRPRGQTDTSTEAGPPRDAIAEETIEA